MNEELQSFVKLSEFIFTLDFFELFIDKPRGYNVETNLLEDNFLGRSRPINEFVGEIEANL